MNHQTEGMIVHCIDFRFQKIINKWISEHIRPKIFDRVALAGATKNLSAILDQVDITLRLHHIKKVVLINHEDCGTYGQAGTPEKHSEDLSTAKNKIQQLYPGLEITTYYLHLDGLFEPIVK